MGNVREHSTDRKEPLKLPVPDHWAMDTSRILQNILEAFCSGLGPETLGSRVWNNNTRLWDQIIVMEEYIPIGVIRGTF